MALVLDSSVVIDLLRGDVLDESVLAPEREPVMISAITVHEVLAGLRDGERELTIGPAQTGRVCSPVRGG